jgi:thiamine pyrophosphokinase
MRILSPRGCDAWLLEGHEGATFSVIALEEGSVVSERGSAWELDHARLGLLDDEGVSNVVRSGEACVTCHAGCVAAFLMR